LLELLEEAPVGGGSDGHGGGVWLGAVEVM
jgi:hypothetical protein